MSIEPSRQQPLRTPPSPKSVFLKLQSLTDSNALDEKMLDKILHSLLITKPLFISNIRNDELLTAKFLKYFPSSKDYLNYSEITMLGHVLIFSIEFEDKEAVKKYRTKIGAHDIWSIEGRSDGDLFKILEKITERIPRSEVEEVAGDVRGWYREFKGGYD